MDRANAPHRILCTLFCACILAFTKATVAATTIVGIDLGLTDKQLAIATNVASQIAAEQADDSIGLVAADELVRFLIEPVPAAEFPDALSALALEPSDSGNIAALLERSQDMLNEAGSDARLWIISSGEIKLPDNETRVERFQLWATDILLPDIIGTHPEFRLLTPEPWNPLIADAVISLVGPTGHRLLPDNTADTPRFVESLTENLTIATAPVAAPADSNTAVDEGTASNDTAAETDTDAADESESTNTGQFNSSETSTDQSPDQTSPETTEQTPVAQSENNLPAITVVDTETTTSTNVEAEGQQPTNDEQATTLQIDVDSTQPATVETNTISNDRSANANGDSTTVSANVATEPEDTQNTDVATSDTTVIQQPGIELTIKPIVESTADAADTNSNATSTPETNTGAAGNNTGIISNITTLISLGIISVLAVLAAVFLRNRRVSRADETGQQETGPTYNPTTEHPLQEGDNRNPANNLSDAATMVTGTAPSAATAQTTINPRELTQTATSPATPESDAETMIVSDKPTEVSTNDATVVTQPTAQPTARPSTTDTTALNQLTPTPQVDNTQDDFSVFDRSIIEKRLAKLNDSDEKSPGESSSDKKGK